MMMKWKRMRMNMRMNMRMTYEEFPPDIGMNDVLNLDG